MSKMSVLLVPSRLIQLKARIAGGSLQTLSDKVGVSVHTLDNYINGITIPRLDKLIQISEKSGHSLNWLCGE